MAIRRRPVVVAIVGGVVVVGLALILVALVGCGERDCPSQRTRDFAKTITAVGYRQVAVADSDFSVDVVLIGPSSVDPIRSVTAPGVVLAAPKAQLHEEDMESLAIGDSSDSMWINCTLGGVAGTATGCVQVRGQAHGRRAGTGVTGRGCSDHRFWIV